MKINILALSWRDLKNPKSGGAEIHTHEMLKRLDTNTFKVVHISPKFKGAIEREVIDGITYIRKGNIISVIFESFIYYMKNRKKIDFVIEQCNTHRFFTKFWVNKNKRIFYIHQLTREIWDIQLKFPFNKIGKILETPMLRLNKNDIALTVSESTKRDLISVGFNKDKIFIIPNGLNFEQKKFNELVEDDKDNTFIYVGRYAYYKGIDIAIEALGLIKEEHRGVSLLVLGKKDDAYIQQHLIPICEKYHLTYGNQEGYDIVFKGFVDDKEKFELMRRSKALVFPSIREGWGIIVIEAASMGTPSIVYNSPGCRDAVDFGNAGYLCDENSVQEVARLMERVLDQKDEYKEKRKAAYDYSTGFNWDMTGKKINEVLKQLKQS